MEKVSQQPIPRIPLMMEKMPRIPNPEVVEKMQSREYRLKVLRQMIEQRFLTAKIDINDLAELGKLDSKIITLIQDNFGSKMIGNNEANQLYLDLCFNQSLLGQALAELRAQKKPNTLVQ